MRILMTGVGNGSNYTRTVVQTTDEPVDLSAYADVLTYTQRQLLDAKHGGRARVWGLSYQKIHAAMQPGDQVWFHGGGFPGGAGYVTAVADVVTLFTNPGLSEALWDRRNTEYIVTLTAPIRARIAKADLNAYLGHHPADRWQKTILLDDADSAYLADHLALTLSAH